MYTSLAQVYDEMMGGVDYPQWVNFAQEAVARFPCVQQPLFALDLACGTGNATLYLARKGYQVVGVDQAAEMLAVADAKARAQGLEGRITWCQADLRQWQPPRRFFSLVTAFCDGLNYIIKPEELTEVFRRVRQALIAKGLFIFDLNTPFKFASIYKDNTYAENFPSGSYIWENSYDPKSRICDFFLTLFVRRGNLYEKFNEHHQERAYSLEEIEAMLREAGLNYLGVYDDYSWGKPQPFCLRYTFVAQAP